MGGGVTRACDRRGMLDGAVLLGDTLSSVLLNERYRVRRRVGCIGTDDGDKG